MKKIALIIIIIVLCIVLVLAAYDHFAFKEQLAVNGKVYTQHGENITQLPADSVKLGTLTTISHRTTESPNTNFKGTNLDAKYAGCPIYQSGEIIYLEDFSGFYIPFELGE